MDHDKEFRLEMKKWRQLPNGDYLLELRVQPDFIFTFTSGRKEEHTVAASVVLPFSTVIAIADLNKTAQAIAAQAQKSLMVMLGRTLWLASHGFILRHRGNGRPRGRPIARWNVKEVSRIITV